MASVDPVFQISYKQLQQIQLQFQQLSATLQQEVQQDIADFWRGLGDEVNYYEFRRWQQIEFDFRPIEIEDRISQFDDCLKQNFEWFNQGMSNLILGLKKFQLQRRKSQITGSISVESSSKQTQACNIDIPSKNLDPASMFDEKQMSPKFVDLMEETGVEAERKWNSERTVSELNSVILLPSTTIPVPLDCPTSSELHLTFSDQDGRDEADVQSPANPSKLEVAEMILAGEFSSNNNHLYLDIENINLIEVDGFFNGTCESGQYNSPAPALALYDCVEAVVELSIHRNYAFSQSFAGSGFSNFLFTVVMERFGSCHALQLKPGSVLVHSTFIYNGEVFTVEVSTTGVVPKPPPHPPPKLFPPKVICVAPPLFVGFLYQKIEYKGNIDFGDCYNRWNVDVTLFRPLTIGGLDEICCACQVLNTMTQRRNCLVYVSNMVMFGKRQTSLSLLLFPTLPFVKRQNEMVTVRNNFDVDPGGSAVLCFSHENVRLQSLQHIAAQLEVGKGHFVFILLLETELGAYQRFVTDDFTRGLMLDLMSSILDILHTTFAITVNTEKEIQHPNIWNASHIFWRPSFHEEICYALHHLVANGRFANYYLPIPSEHGFCHLFISLYIGLSQMENEFGHATVRNMYGFVGVLLQDNGAPFSEVQIAIGFDKFLNNDSETCHYSNNAKLQEITITTVVVLPFGCPKFTLFSSLFDPGCASGISVTTILGLLGMLVEGGADNANQCFLEAFRFGSTEPVRNLLQFAQSNSLAVDVDFALDFASYNCKIGTMECLVEVFLPHQFIWFEDPPPYYTFPH